jgi:hypothetical protein
MKEVTNSPFATPLYPLAVAAATVAGNPRKARSHACAANGATAHCQQPASHGYADSMQQVYKASVALEHPS